MRGRRPGNNDDSDPVWALLGFCIYREPGWVWALLGFCILRESGRVWALLGCCQQNPTPCWMSSSESVWSCVLREGSTQGSLGGTQEAGGLGDKP